MKKALIITGKLVQDHEFIYPYYRAKEAGFEVFVALKNAESVFGSLGTKIPCDDVCKIIDYKDMKVKDYDLLIIPGGAKCMEYLRQEEKVLNFISEFDKSGKIIACICHGTQLLISAKVVKNRKISGYYSIKDDVNNAGAIYVNSPAVIDKNIITSPHYKYLPEWMMETLRLCN